MISLTTFRFVGRHAMNLLSGIYLAAVLAHIIGRPHAECTNMDIHLSFRAVDSYRCSRNHTRASPWPRVAGRTRDWRTSASYCWQCSRSVHRTRYRALRTSSWVFDNLRRVGTYFLGGRLFADDAGRLS